MKISENSSQNQQKQKNLQKGTKCDALAVWPSEQLATESHAEPPST